MCSVGGEVMKAALPSDLCLEGLAEALVTEKYKLGKKLSSGLENHSRRAA